MTKTKKVLRPNEKLNKKLDRLDLTDTELAERLGYADSSPISKRRKGISPWSIADAVNLERISGGKIRQQEVCPEFFKTLPPAHDPEV